MKEIVFLVTDEIAEDLCKKDISYIEIRHTHYGLSQGVRHTTTSVNLARVQEVN